MQPTSQAPTWEKQDQYDPASFTQVNLFLFRRPRRRKDVGGTSPAMFPPLFVVDNFHSKQWSCFLTHQFLKWGREATRQNSWGEFKKKIKLINLLLLFVMIWLCDVDSLLLPTSWAIAFDRESFCKTITTSTTDQQFNAGWIRHGVTQLHDYMTATTKSCIFCDKVLTSSLNRKPKICSSRYESLHFFKRVDHCLPMCCGHWRQLKLIQA